MKIQILGTGCAKCANLASQAEAAARLRGGDFTLEKVTDLGTIVSMGVMVTPALIVDGTLKHSGSVPSVEQIVQMLEE